MSTSSRTSKSLKNISTGMLAQVIQMILGFVSRTIFIKYLAIEYLGVNSLFSNILSLLSLAELGLGSAFIYALYKPLSENKKEEIASIIKFYKKTYLLVGVFIFIIGSSLIPFLSDIIPEKPAVITEDIRLIYFIFLFNTASSYLFTYKISLLEADQKISVATVNSIKFSIGQILFQIVVLILTSNFILYLLVQTIFQFSSNWYISKIVDKQYPFLKTFKNLNIEKAPRSTIISNIKATFIIKIAGVLVNSTDNLFINYFVGLAILGKFSNYLMLIAMISSIVMIVFSSIRSSVANVIVKESIQKQRELFSVLNFLNFWVFGLGAIMFIFTIDNFISVWIGGEYLLPKSISIVMAISFLMLGLQNGFWTFKSSYGYFHEGKYLILLTALINLVLSYYLGLSYGILGILVATVIARLLTNFWYDPYIVLSKGLKLNPVFYLFRFGKYMAVLLISYSVLYFISINLTVTPIYALLINGSLAFIITNLIIYLSFKRSSEMKQALTLAQKIVKSLK